MTISELKNNKQLMHYLSTQPVLKAWVFGSVARGEANEQSDLDLLLETAEKTSIFDFVRIKLGVEDLLHLSVDAISTGGMSPYIQPFIEADKILIYERKG